jgi:hypothetical protein
MSGIQIQNNFSLISKVGTQAYFFSTQNLKSANFLGVPVCKTQIRTFPLCPSPQIAKAQVCKDKSSVSHPGPHWFASNIFLPM